MKLFKYFTPKATGAIINRTIRLRPLNRFNDPFECLPRVSGTYTEDSIRADLKHRSARRLVRDAMRADRVVDIPDDEVDEYFATNNQTVLGYMRITAPCRLLIISQRLRDEYSSGIGVSCFSSIADSILMWSQYADDHAGFILEYETGPWAIAGQPAFSEVTYMDSRVPIYTGLHREDIAPRDTLIQLMTTKGADWKHEREWRAFIDISKMEPSYDDRGPYYDIVVPSLSIRGVIFGVRTEEMTTRAILNAIHEQPDLQHIHVSRVIPHESRYSLNIVPYEGNLTPSCLT